jgi:hypothetical protein
MNRAGRRAAATMLIVAGAAQLAGCSAGEEPAGTTALPRGSEAVALDPDDFTTAIDNRFWPMRPGTRWTYRETGGGEELTAVVTATGRTKRIANGVEARVVRDTVTRGTEIIEDTFDWYAQDAAGAVWYLGEDTAEFENGRVVSRAGSFEAGVDGALAGVALPAEPRPGDRYRQEYYRGVAEDNGEVLSGNEMADVAYGHVDGLLLTKDTSTIEPGVLEYKLYAPGVGPVLTLDIAGGTGREELVRVDRVADDAGTGPLGSPD